DVPQGAAVGHTVEDDQRIVACCYGIPAPDQNRLARRSPCGRGLYHDPRYGSLNDLAKRAIAHQLQSFNGDGGDGTGDIAPPLRAVTDDDYLITLICFLEELETHGRSLAVYHSTSRICVRYPRYEAWRSYVPGATSEIVNRPFSSVAAPVVVPDMTTLAP